jgi:hypothetical protein
LKISYKWNYKSYIVDICEGIYNIYKWNKDEQLIKLNDWILLKTGVEFNTDKLFLVRLDVKSGMNINSPLKI